MEENGNGKASRDKETGTKARKEEERKWKVKRYSTTDKTGQGWNGENGSRKGEHFKCYLHLNHGKEGYS